MSVVSLLFRQAPILGSGENALTFDAVLEDRLSASVEYTQFPIEVGAKATDHGIIQPMVWSMKGVVSNNKLAPGLTDFAGGFVSNFFDSGVIAAAGGFSAGFLAGSDGTRASGALEALLTIMRARLPFDANAGDINLKNMVIVELFREKNPENENGLEFEAILMELPILPTVISNQQPQPSQLRDGDPAKTQAAAKVQKGEQLGRGPAASVVNKISSVFGAN